MAIAVVSLARTPPVTSAMASSVANVASRASASTTSARRASGDARAQRQGASAVARVGVDDDVA